MTRKLPMLLVLMACVVSPPAAAKKAGESPGLLHAGVRTAYTLPFGLFTGSEDSLYLYDLYSGMVPLWVDLEMSLTPNLRVGVFGQAALAQLRRGCDTCSGNDFGVGLQASYHFNPRGRVDPWAGLGLGYEWTNFQSPEFSMGYRGPALQLQAGGDYDLGNRVRIGPFVNLTVGQYTHLEVKLANGGAATESIRHLAPHFWLALGLRLQMG